MALRIHLLSQNPIQSISSFPTNRFPALPSTMHFPNRSAAVSRAAANDGVELTARFEAEVGNRRSQIEQREEAMEKSRKLLFDEYVSFTGLQAAEVKKNWAAMEADEKLTAAMEFIASGWGDNFHPLSVKCAVELMDEFLEEERVKMKADDGFSYERILSFRRLVGF